MQYYVMHSSLSLTPVAELAPTGVSHRGWGALPLSLSSPPPLPSDFTDFSIYFELLFQPQWHQGPPT